MKRQIALLLLPFLFACARTEQHPITTIIIVRHGERATQAADSPLSDLGFVRANELARALTDVKVDAIYATQFVRTQQTIAPLAQAHRLEPVIVKTGNTYAHDLASDILTHHAGQTVVVASHADTIPSVLKELGIANPPEITMTEYDDLFVCTPPKLLILRYGAPSER